MQVCVFILFGVFANCQHYCSDESASVCQYVRACVCVHISLSNHQSSDLFVEWRVFDLGCVL